MLSSYSFPFRVLPQCHLTMVWESPLLPLFPPTHSPKLNQHGHAVNQQWTFGGDQAQTHRIIKVKNIGWWWPDTNSQDILSDSLSFSLCELWHKVKMVGPHYSSEQRKFMAIEYAKNQGRRDFMDLIIADFQVRYPGVPPHSRFTIYRQFQKLDLYHILHYLNSKVSLLTILKWSILSVCKAKGPPLSALFRQAPGWLIVAGQEVQWLLPMQLPKHFIRVFGHF